jgi:hypothetical protein
MSIPVPEGIVGSYALDTSKLLSVDGDPALAELLPNVMRASGEVHSGIHAIYPGPPIGNEGVEMPKHMQMDWDDQERTEPCIQIDTLMAQISHPEGQPPEGDEFDDKTVIVPKPAFDPEETLDEYPMGDDEVLGEADEVAVDVVEELGEADEVDPKTERNPLKPATPDDDHNKPTWPKIPAALPIAPSGLGSVDQGTDAFRDAVVKALTTDPDGEFALVDDDEIEVV